MIVPSDVWQPDNFSLKLYALFSLSVILDSLHLAGLFKWKVEALIFATTEPVLKREKNNNMKL